MKRNKKHSYESSFLHGLALGVLLCLVIVGWTLIVNEVEDYLEVVQQRDKDYKYIMENYDVLSANVQKEQANAESSRPTRSSETGTVESGE